MIYKQYVNDVSFFSRTDLYARAARAHAALSRADIDKHNGYAYDLEKNVMPRYKGFTISKN